jgi:hypothetical protein
MDSSHKPPAPIDLARDMIAKRLEREFPGAHVTHNDLGWRAVDDRGRELARAESVTGLQALLPYSGL